MVETSGQQNALFRYETLCFLELYHTYEEGVRMENKGTHVLLKRRDAVKYLGTIVANEKAD